MPQVYEILNILGYSKLSDEGKFYRTNALYRNGSNRSSMVIRKDNGSFKDFKTDRSGSLRELILLHTNNPEEADKLLEGFNPNGYSYTSQQPEIPKQISYDRSILTKLQPKWDLYLNDGITEKTLQEFEVGYKAQDHLFHRYCFPIYNEKNRIIGFAGRHRDKEVPERVAKWKLHGKKTDWVWPLHLNAIDIAESKEVILVESPNCVLHLWEAGIKNVICLFGIELSAAVFNFLIKEQPNKIIIATNNDSTENGYAGQEAAKKIKDVLAHFFYEKRLLIALPLKKDFGVMSKQEILLWKSRLS